jgi:hypothetical protein
MSNWFMLHNNGEHHKVVEGLYLHYPDTCEVADVVKAGTTFDPRPSGPTSEIRLSPSRLGWVAICYEEKGFITFSVQLNHKRQAWQRIAWSANFQEKWDNKKVREAIDNFLWVAECEEAKQILPKH